MALRWALVLVAALTVSGAVAFEGASNTGKCDAFLECWQTKLMPVIKNLSVLDLTLPGTHDTLTYDLSTTVSDGAIDGPEALSWVLHSWLAPLVPGSWIRSLAITQTLSVTDQLDAGVRFLDLRLMQEFNALGQKGDWMSLHFVQSNELFITYLKQVREWLDNHPSEFIFVELTKHGNECATGQDQFPKVSVEDKQKMWKAIESTLDGLLFDRTLSTLNDTSVETLIERGHRVIVFAADHKEFTDSSKYAFDICKSTTWHGPDGPEKEEQAARWKANFAAGATARNRQNKAKEHMYVLGLSHPVSTNEIKDLAKAKWLPSVFGGGDKAISHCAKELFSIPEMDDWCPPDLIELTTLNNYYHQSFLQTLAPASTTRDLPAVVAVDHVFDDGTLLVDYSGDRQTSSSFVDILLAVNVNRACYGVHEDRAHAAKEQCEELSSVIQSRVAAKPPQLWDEPERGRHNDWPKTV